MDKYTQIAESIRAIAKKGDRSAPVLIPAVVKDITDDSCTVIIHDGLELKNIRLKTTINGKNATNKLLVIPKEGSQVLIASLSGDLRDLAVVKVDSPEYIEYAQNKFKIYVDATNEKIAVENSQTSLLQILTDLAEALKTFQVSTPAGPSGKVLPNTEKAVKKFEDGFKQLLMVAEERPATKK